MMTGLQRCIAAAAAVLGASTVASATVIQYQPHDQQRGVIVEPDSVFTDNLGLWSEEITAGSQRASQLSLLGPQIVVGWQEASGPDAASVMDIRFSVNNTTPFDLSASTSAIGFVLTLRDLTTSTNLAFFVPRGADSATFTGELTAGHDFALLSTLIDPFGAAPEAQVFFSIHQSDDDSLTLVPTPGAGASLALAGLALVSRRRR